MRLFAPSALLGLSILNLPAQGTPPVDLLYHHCEVQLDYTHNAANPDAGWNLSVSYNLNDDFTDSSQVVRLDPATATLVAAPRTGMTSTGAPLTITSAVSRLGPVGAPLWVMSQNNLFGTNYLGMRAIFQPGVFQARVGSNYIPSATGSISLRLVSATGTGPAAGGNFALWESELGNIIWYFDTSDGIGSADERPTIPAGAHSHFNWGFTKPGSYNLTFEAKGRLMPTLSGGALTSAQKTFHFQIPFSSRLQNQAALRVVHDPASARWAVLAEDTASDVAYMPDQGFLEATTAATTAQTAIPSAQWQMPLAWNQAGSAVRNFVGLAPALAAAGVPAGTFTGGNVQAKLLSVTGPGRFALLNAAGTSIVFDSGDGITAADAFTLGSGALDTLAAFTATGLYRVTLQLSGTTTAGGALRQSPPITLVFGAGLTAGHTYAQWQASFETQAGLPPGTLASPNADSDADGVANGTEFLLFWHGFDPTTPDGRLLPRPGRDATWTFCDFMRDTYKDPLTEQAFQLVAATSSNLSLWTQRKTRVPGFPLGTYETGAEEGNAYGRIMKRRLRTPHGGSPFGFFRFEMTHTP